MSAPDEKIDDQTRLAVLEVARDRYAMGSDDDVEIDDNADVHHNGDAGYWVQAWVYVPEVDVS